MVGMNPDDYAFEANFTPVMLAAKSSAFRSGLMRNLLILVLAAVVYGILYLTQKPMNPTAKSWILWFGGFSLVLGIFSGARLWWVNHLLARLGRGVAVRIDPAGMIITGKQGRERVLWSQITAVASKNHQHIPGPELLIQGQGKKQRWKVPFSYLDVMPGSIDSAVRAHTGGRMQLDLSRLDRIW